MYFLNVLIRHQSYRKIVQIACLADIWQKSPSDVGVLHLFMAKDGLQKYIFTCFLQVIQSDTCFFERYKVRNLTTNYFMVFNVVEFSLLISL